MFKAALFRSPYEGSHEELGAAEALRVDHVGDPNRHGVLYEPAACVTVGCWGRSVTFGLR